MNASEAGAAPGAPRDLHARPRPIVWVSRMGNMANYMIQLMAAYSLASRVKDAVVCAEGLPEWNLYFTEQDDRTRPTLIITDEYHRLDMEGLAGLLARGEISRIDLRCYAQHVDNFLPRQFYQELFHHGPQLHPGWDASHLVINIRGNEVLDAIHPLYTQLPIGFYAALIERTGLKPVFMGQLGENAYCRALRAAFPDAVFQESAGAMGDFEIIRRSRNIVPSISTFSWLAAWLSDAEQIHLPLSGLFHPLQTYTIDLVPRRDPRYRLHLFPTNFAIGIDRLAEAHAPLQGLWREVSEDMLGGILAAAPRNEPSREDWLACYSEQHYLDANRDVQEAVSLGYYPSGLDHFGSAGLAEKRPSFAFDTEWYSRAYPLAALEVGQGDFRDLRHHFVGIGRRRGYHATPSPTD